MYLAYYSSRIDTSTERCIEDVSIGGFDCKTCLAVRKRPQPASQRKTAVIVPQDLHLSAETESGLYWIAQEALNNALKHAQADEIENKLTQEPDRFVMSISDNGVGMTTAVATAPDTDISNKGTLGHRSMQERSANLGWQPTIHIIPSESHNSITESSAAMSIIESWLSETHCFLNIEWGTRSISAL